MGRARENNTYSMKSTWATADPSTWNGYQKFINYVRVNPILPGEPLPVVPKDAKVPVMSQLSMNFWIVLYLALPMVAHQAWFWLTGSNLGRLGVFMLYNLAYVLNAGREVRCLRKVAYQHGCLDGDHKRDGIPDFAAGKIILEMHKTAGFRMAMAAVITYDPSLTPLDVVTDGSWWLGLLAKLSLYGTLIDLFFYSYHRACHEVPALWKYHRTHHLTKHPTAVLSAFGDDEQEIIEMILVPLGAYAVLWAVGLKMGFYEWWACFQYVTFSEIMGHSGLRVHTVVPSPVSWLLEMLDMELALEDHDLHHRKGWKKSFNYGKQTRVFDRIFGSVLPRQEVVREQLDHSQVVYVPLW